MPLTHSDIPIISAALQVAFRTFNTQILQECLILNRTSQEQAVIIEATELDVTDCDQIAHFVVRESAHLPMVTGSSPARDHAILFHKHAENKSILPFLRKQALHNSVLMKRNVNGSLILIIKTRAHYRTPAHHTHLVKIGSNKIIKDGLCCEIDTNSPPNLRSYRVITWSRTPVFTLEPGPRDPNVKISRERKTRELEARIRRIGTVGFECMRFRQRGNWLLKVDGVLYFQPYKGIQLKDIQTAHAISGGYLAQNFPIDLALKTKLMFAYLSACYDIFVNQHFWMADLKIENTTAVINPPSIVMYNVDYNDVVLTFSISIKQILPQRNDIPWFADRLRELRSGISLPAIHFNILRNQLIVEIMHVLFIFSHWPYVYRMGSLVCNHPYTISFRAVPTPSCPAGYNVNGGFLALAINSIFSEIELNHPVTFAQMLERVYAVQVPVIGRLPWPAEFDAVWRANFARVIDSWNDPIPPAAAPAPGLA